MYVRVTALRAAQNALAGRMRPAGRSLPASEIQNALLGCRRSKGQRSSQL